jgi:hypothetical protein
VQCESCHGPAGNWLHEHDRVGFSRDSSFVFIDTKDLAQRAATCMPCHVGPSHSNSRSQVVDHDLIAAGHPRLAFEFYSYFESLPAHWDRSADKTRHSGDFHFRSWLAGQTQQAGQRELLSREPPLDFACLNCFACHHQLAAGTWRRPSPFGPLAATDWPHRALPDSSQRIAPQRRLALVRELLLDSRDQHTGWDASVQALLAARAALADITPQSHQAAAGELASAAAAVDPVGLYLASDCFSSIQRPATAYDSPTEFDAREFSRHVTPLIDAIQRLEATLPPR